MSKWWRLSVVSDGQGLGRGTVQIDIADKPLWQRVARIPTRRGLTDIVLMVVARPLGASHAATDPILGMCPYRGDQ